MTQLSNDLNNLAFSQLVQHFRIGRNVCNESLKSGPQSQDLSHRVRIHFQVDPVVQTDGVVLHDLNPLRSEQKQVQGGDHAHILARNGFGADLLAEDEEGQRELEFLELVRAVDGGFVYQSCPRLCRQHFAFFLVNANVWIVPNAQ